MKEIQCGGYYKHPQQGSRHLEIGFGVHAASYLVGTGYSFRESGNGRGVNYTTHPHLVSRLKISPSAIRLHCVVLNEVE
jgi:hypothetical protein